MARPEGIAHRRLLQQEHRSRQKLLSGTAPGKKAFGHDWGGKFTKSSIQDFVKGQGMACKSTGAQTKGQRLTGMAADRQPTPGFWITVALVAVLANPLS